MIQRNEIPCKDCKDRVLGCHDYCDKYKVMKQKSIERNKVVAEAMAIERMNKGVYSRRRR